MSSFQKPSSLTQGRVNSKQNAKNSAKNAEFLMQSELNSAQNAKISPKNKANSAQKAEFSSQNHQNLSKSVQFQSPNCAHKNTKNYAHENTKFDETNSPDFQPNTADFPLYESRFEHDACGIAAVANIKGVPSHKVIKDALDISSTS